MGVLLSRNGTCEPGFDDRAESVGFGFRNDTRLHTGIHVCDIRGARRRPIGKACFGYCCHLREDDTVPVLLAMQARRADVFEVGVPFSVPSQRSRNYPLELSM
ncbi:hypothetical protein M404DRAFT_828634 [Pisolithus tinctorius Marx 270]|uniref:Tryptophan synthase n=1 Tax=Pisolithus tinctorius Marx 270 TaxID=870435 RepID=A0A0C3KN25_PISTI|nr:hypothetical protein M404DRAFT_828634 [Pisolithus tinctorius Marx 270]